MLDREIEAVLETHSRNMVRGAQLTLFQFCSVCGQYAGLGSTTFVCKSCTPSPDEVKRERQRGYDAIRDATPERKTYTANKVRNLRAKKRAKKQ